MMILLILLFKAKMDIIEILRGDIFIVPNSLSIYDNVDLECYDTENIQGLQVCFQAWITNDECENWCRHSYDKFGLNISEHFPVELFLGKREGDEVDLMIKGKSVVVTCRQQKYKYGSDSFENILYHLTKSFGGVCSSKHFNPPLSCRSQLAMYVVNHERFARSHGFEIVEPIHFNCRICYSEQCKADFKTVQELDVEPESALTRMLSNFVN